MKTTLSFILATALLCGCGESAHEKAMDKEIADLKTSYASLSNQLVLVSSEESGLFTIESNQTEQLAALGDAQKGVPQLSTADLAVSAPIDPRTGLPIVLPLVVFPASGRVTEANNQWRRWGVKFAIGNPNPMDETREATLKFLDRDGYIIETRTEHHLAIPALSTNLFTSEQLIDLPQAQNVKSIQVSLE